MPAKFDSPSCVGSEMVDRAGFQIEARSIQVDVDKECSKTTEGGSNRQASPCAGSRKWTETKGHSGKGDRENAAACVLPRGGQDGDWGVVEEVGAVGSAQDRVLGDRAEQGSGGSGRDGRQLSGPDEHGDQGSRGYR